MAGFDKYTKEIHEMTAEHAGPKAAAATFWLTLVAYWFGGLTIIIGALVLATKFLFPYVSAFSRLPFPQMGNAAVAFAIAIGVVGLAGVWFTKTFRRTVVNAFSTRLTELELALSALRNSTDNRVGEFAEMFASAFDRVTYLESHAASTLSVNDAFRKLHEKMSLRRPPSGVPPEGNLHRQALVELLNSPAAHSVGHPLRIDEATYGAHGMHIDVKEVLEAAITDNHIRLTVTNTTMGRDPEYGVEKQLHVRYSCGGTTRDVTVPEGQELRIPE
jgi:hypothetical protein